MQLYNRVTRTKSRARKGIKKQTSFIELEREKVTGALNGDIVREGRERRLREADEGFWVLKKSV